MVANLLQGNPIFLSWPSNNAPVNFPDIEPSINSSSQLMVGNLIQGVRDLQGTSCLVRPNDLHCESPSLFFFFFQNYLELTLDHCSIKTSLFYFSSLSLSSLYKLTKPPPPPPPQGMVQILPSTPLARSKPEMMFDMPKNFKFLPSQS